MCWWVLYSVLVGVIQCAGGCCTVCCMVLDSVPLGVIYVPVGVIL